MRTTGHTYVQHMCHILGNRVMPKPLTKMTQNIFCIGNDEIQKNGKEYAMLSFYQCGVNGMKNTLLMRTMPPIIPIAHTFDFRRFFMLIPYLREGTITRVVSAVCYFSHIPSLIA
jgi:hypothetical protein